MLPSTGAVTGAPRLLLRLEGLAVLLLAAWLHAIGGHPWGLFALLFLTPDLGFLAYLAGPRVGAAGYNALHSYLGPALLAGWALATGGGLEGPAARLALIWAAHIGFDRMLGYGLKYGTGFHVTHLGALTARARVSRPASSP